MRKITILGLLLMFVVLEIVPTQAQAVSISELSSQLSSLQQLLNSYTSAGQPQVLGVTTVVVTTNAELKAAITNAKGGETIQLAPGTYGQLRIQSKNYTTPVTFTSLDPNNRAVISSFVILLSSNVTLDRLNTKYTYPIAATPAIATWTRANEINNSKNIIVRNTTVEGDVDASGYGALIGLGIRWSNAVTIDTSVIKNWNIGIVHSESKSTTLTGNEITKISGDGIENSEVQNVIISNNYIHDFLRAPASNIHPDMIQFWTAGTKNPSTDVTISNNRLDIGNGSWTQSIFMRNELVDTGAATFAAMAYRNFTIENNTIKNVHLNGITLGETDGVIIRGNTLTSDMPNSSTDPTTINFLKTYSSNNPIFSPAIRPSFYSKNVLVENNTFLGQTNNSPTNLRITGYVNQADWTVRNNTLNGVAIVGGTGTGIPTPTPTPTAPTLTLSTSQSSVATGGSATLTWNSTNSTACTATGDWTGTKTTSGSMATGALTTVGTKTYTLICTGATGSVTKTVSIIVSNTTIPTTGTPVKVVAGDYINVRATPNGVILGTQLAGSQGTQSTALPIVAGTMSWVYVDFVTGVDGYAAKQLLVVTTPTDTDADGVADTVDNCPSVTNANQANFDNDTQGDACDSDDDNDGILDTAEKTGCILNPSASCGIVVPPTSNAKYNNFFSTYLDGSINKSGPDGMTRDVAFDVSGNMYVTGGTKATDFPTTVGAYDRTYNTGGKSLGRLGDMDIFVMKFNPQGTLLWSTLLGGPNYDRTYAIEVGPSGEVVVAGRAGEGFPTTAGVVQSNFLNDSADSAGFNTEYGRQNGFVTKFDTNGNLQWSSYFSAGVIRDMDIDNQGILHLVPTESPMPLPHVTTNAFQKTLKGTNDGMYAKVSSDGKTLLYGTYIGGSGKDGGNPSVRVNAAGEAYYASWSASTDFPTKNAAQATNKGLIDNVLVKFATDGSLIFSTYFGGSKGELMETHALGIDNSGNAYLGGSTQSSNLLSSNGADSTLSGASDAFVAKFSPTGTFLNATYLGGNSTDMLEGMAFNNNTQELVVTGTTGSSDFAKTGAYDATLSGNNDGYIAKLSADLSAITYTTFMGGAGVDELRAVDVYEPSGAIIVGGITRSSNLTVVNALDSVLNSSDAADFAVYTPSAGGVIIPDPTTPTVTLSSSVTTIQINDTATLNWTSTNATACTASGDWSGVKAMSGLVVTPALTAIGTKIYTLTCTGTGGTVTKTVSVGVTAVPVATSPFTLGMRVQTIGTVNVRATAGGIVLGTQTDAKVGTIANDTPVLIEGYTYVPVNFDSGIDGWVADAFFKNAGNIVVPPIPTAPTLVFTVSNANVVSGSKAVLTWSASGATSCLAGGTWGALTRPVIGTFTTDSLNTVGIKTFMLTCSGSGGTVTKSVSVTVITPPPVILDTDADTVADINDNCSSISNLDQANFDRDTQGDACDADDDNDGIVDTAEKASCILDASVTCGIISTPPQSAIPTLTFSTVKVQLQSGEKGVLTWSSTGAISCVGSGIWGVSSRATSGSFTTDSLVLPGLKTYTITCSGAGGTVTKSVNITVNAVPVISATTPVLVLTATPTVVKGGSAVVSWSSTNVSSCIASGEWQGVKELSGSYVKPNRNWVGKESFTLTCTGSHGSTSKTVVVEVVEKIVTSTSANVGPLVSSTAIQAFVTTKDGIRVRTTPNGQVIGLQAKGSAGKLVSEQSEITGGYVWVRVDFVNGPDGYVAIDYLNIPETSSNTLLLEQLNSLLESLQSQLQLIK